jgi:hypothetical protein
MNAQRSYGQRMIVLALVLAFIVPAKLSARSTNSLTHTEIFVLHKVQAGEEADLDNSRVRDHSLSADFLADLISGRYKTPELELHGVKISHAVVKEKLVLASRTIPYQVWLKFCQFEAGVDFEYTRFGRDLSFEGSTFGTPMAVTPQTASRSTPTALPCQQVQASSGQSSDAGDALFIGMKVDGPLNFDCATFYVHLNLTYAEVASEFLFDHVHYESAENADFESLKAKAPAFFREDHFAGKIVLADSQLFELFIENPLPPGTIDLDLTQARIEHLLSIRNTNLSSFTAPFFVDSGEGTFDSVVPQGTISLVHSHFKNLTITKFDNWLKAGATSLNSGTQKVPPLHLEGLSFESIDLPDETVEPQAKRMVELINSDRCPYSPQPYLELEKFLRDHGYPEEADDVFIAMQQRERKQLAWWKRPFDWLLYALVGYGREPGRAVILALFLALAGAFVFARDWMEPEDKSSDRWYNSFWYSLDLLSPIDLGIAKKWRPGESRRWMRGYAQIHRILGWLLIPLILAAITGIIK